MNIAIGIAAVILTAGAVPAMANDSTAELSTGGLRLARTDAIVMAKEDLFISMEKVEVDYVFHNNTDQDVDTIVAFPMPDIEASPYEMVSIPNEAADNFLGFEVSVEGKPVEANLEQKASAVGVSIDEDLKAHNVPFYPGGDATLAALDKLPQDVADDWQSRGLIVIDEYDEGQGMKKVRTPVWRLGSTYWWRTTFPANKDVRVSHSYMPSLGGSAGLNFFTEGRIGGEGYADYKKKYCLDSGFEQAVLKAAKQGEGGYPRLNENRIAYVLTTGGNWATGQIGDFRLTIDKGDPKNLLSFCGDGIRKTGPTTFEMTAKDFYPSHDIDVLILHAWDFDDRSLDEPNGGGQPGAAGNQTPIDSEPTP